MKQTEIARRHKISPSTLSRVLNGRVSLSNLTVDTATRIAALLDIPLDRAKRSKPSTLKRKFFSMYEVGK